MKESVKHELKRPSEYALEAVGFLGAPLVWAAEFTISYAVVQHTCSTGKFYLLYLLSATAFVLALGATAVAWRIDQRISAASDGEAPAGRARFMAIAGLMISTLFTLVIVAEAIPRFILSPCD